jgi:hypothetical protein
MQLNICCSPCKSSAMGLYPSVIRRGRPELGIADYFLNQSSRKRDALITASCVLCCYFCLWWRG